MASPKFQESLNQLPTITSDINQSSVNFKSQELNDLNSSILANTELINLREKPQESIEIFQSIVNALFGDAGDVSSDEENAFEDSEKDKSLKEKLSFSQSDNEEVECDEIPKLIINNIVPNTDDESNKTEEDEQTNAAIINVIIPKISTDLGHDIYFIKLPNFLSVEAKPFKKENYEDEIDEEDTLDEERRVRLKLKVENTIRIRETVDDSKNIIKESNTRFVKWSDGSMSLQVGSEVFDVYKEPLQGDHNHLYIRQGTGLQGRAVFKTKLSFRPYSTDSFTHKKMTVSLADRFQKASGIKILSQVGYNPELNREEMIKKDSKKLNNENAKSKKPKNKRKRRTSESTSGYNDGVRTNDSDDEDAISLAAIKKKYKTKNIDRFPRGKIFFFYSYIIHH